MITPILRRVADIYSTFEANTAQPELAQIRSVWDWCQRSTTMRKDRIAFELMQLHGHLRAVSSPHVKTGIRQRIDRLVHESEGLPDDAVVDDSDFDVQYDHEETRNSLLEKR